MFTSLLARIGALLQRLLGNELSRRIVKNTGYLFSASGISAALSMLQGILVVRILSVADFGILGTITVFTSVINNLASFRMNELVIKYVGQYTENQDQARAAAVFKLAALVEMLASLVAFGLVWLLAPIGAQFFAKDITTTNLFIIYGLIVLANLISESSIGLLQIFDRFRRMAVLNVVQSLITLAVIALAYLFHGGLLEVLLAYAIGKAIGALGLTLAALHVATQHWGKDWWRAPVRLLRPQAREVAHFAISTNISASLSLVTKDSELLWVSFFRSNLETGYYKLALALANLVQIPVNPMPQATYPELSREVARKNYANMRYILKQGSFIAGGYTLVVTLFLILLGQPLINYVYTPELLPAYPALVILSIGLLAANTFYWRRVALLAFGEAGFPARLNLVLAALKVLGIALFVPRYGYLASAALLAGFYWVGSIISLIKIRSLLVNSE
ncbi:MAG: oligosaccharide flippase family protein [Chloroflexota bacterium]